MNTLDIASSTRLVRLLGMLGSAHDGEVVTAGRMADKLVRERGLTWAQVIMPEPPAPSYTAYPPPFDPATEPPETAAEWRQLAAWLVRNFGDELRSHEHKFVDEMKLWRGLPTEKQRAWMQAIAERFRGRT